MAHWSTAHWRTAHWTTAARWLLAASLALGVLLALPRTGPGPASAATVQRPNVVLVMMDDMRYDELRFAPNLQRYVASRGTTFANSFSPLPLCCPARASFLLGQLAHNHRVLRVEAPYGFGALDDHRTIATALSAAGYHTALVGKYLNGYGQMRSRVTGGASLLYEPAGWTDWMASVEKVWPTGSRYSGGTYNYLGFTQNVNRRVVMHPGAYSSDVVGSEAVGLVSKYHRSAKPFFLFLTPVAPHHGGPREARDPADYVKANGFRQQFPTPYTPAWVRGRFDRAVTHAPGVPLHRAAEPDLGDKRPGYARFLENTATEKARLRDVERQRAEAIFAWDRQFGRIVDRLKSTGEYADTVLMFTSDNGYYLGEHRHPAGKIEPHEVSVRVPLVVAGPGVRRGTRYAPVMTHDLTSTILDLAGARPLPDMDGTSLRPVLTGPDRTWDRPVFTEAMLGGIPRTDPDFPAGIHEFGIRTGRYKYVRYADGFEELYDLQEDPNELTGLAQDPAYDDLKTQLLAQWRRYSGCRTTACTAPLPPELQTTPAQLATIDANSTRQQRLYYE